MGWFWADPPTSSTSPSFSTTDRNAQKGISSPAGHPPLAGKPPASCPMHQSSAPPKPKPPPSCPMHNNDDPADHGSSSPYTTTLNPLNLMPNLPSYPIHTDQSVPLPGARTASSIPKGDSPEAGNWEYPSPQQMYNAMRKKGYVESYPGEAASIVNMVEVHNFLNEGAWGEILQWEKEFGKGWKVAAQNRWENNGLAPPKGHGENVSFFDRLRNTSKSFNDTNSEPRLLRFQGRSQEPTPKARILQLIAWAAPNSRFATPPPFDRHDWYVLRNPEITSPDGKKGEEVRYVIDYYSGDPEPTGEPVFYLDVRPALDRPAAVMERAIKWGGEIWWKASGAVVRERERREREKKERADAAAGGK